jgi:large subunit ribosomal protein L28
MSQACVVCGKKPAVGNQITHRGRAKYLGGVGVKTTGITRRTFRPNLRTVKVSAANGEHLTVRVCARCLRSGFVTKTVHQQPFKLPTAHPEKSKSRPAAGSAAAAGKSEAAPAAPAEYKVPEGVKIRKRKRDKKADGPSEQPKE